MSGNRLHLGRYVVVAAVCAMTLSVAAGGLSFSAQAEGSREEVAEDQAAARDHVEDLKLQLTGIDQELAQVYLDLDAAKQQIPDAQAQLDQANADVAAAQRKHQVALDQLDAAQAQKEQVESEIAQAEADQEEAEVAIGQMARQMYQGENQASPVVLAMTATGTQEIDDRAAAADALTRTQTVVLERAKQVQASNQTRVVRDQAVADRIETLEAQAREAAEQADSAQVVAQQKLDDLEDLQAQTEAAQAKWESQKTQAVADLDQAQKDFDTLSAKLAAIDAENRANNTNYQSAPPASSSSQVYSSSAQGFTAPLRIPLVVTSVFGMRLHPVLGVWRLHNGTDFGATCGTPIYPIADGVVSSVTWTTSGGNTVIVNHGMIGGSSWTSMYLHQSNVASYVGQQVNRSTVLGYVGTTGYSTGCHLHLSVLQNGAYVDPMAHL